MKLKSKKASQKLKEKERLTQKIKLDKPQLNQLEKRKKELLKPKNSHKEFLNANMLPTLLTPLKDYLIKLSNQDHSYKLKNKQTHVSLKFLKHSPKNLMEITSKLEKALDQSSKSQLQFQLQKKTRRSGMVSRIYKIFGEIINKIEDTLSNERRAEDRRINAYKAARK